MTHTLLQQKVFTVEEICKKVSQRGIEVGTTFKVIGSNPQISSLVTTEVVFANDIDGRWSFDTLVIGDSFRERYIDDFVMEMRYMTDKRYAVVLESHKRGSKPYHNLLEEQK